jgi:hypothetical protein
VDGLPFIAVGYYYDWSRSEIFDVVRSEVNTGFNSPLPYRPPLPSQIKSVLSFFDTAETYGIKVFLVSLSLYIYKHTHTKHTLNTHTH